MKKILLILSVSILSGCSTFKDLSDAYLMKYDPNEYQLITDIRSTASLSKTHCDNADISNANSVEISKKTYHFKNFAQHLPHNDKVVSASSELDKIAQGLTLQYKKGNVSPIFCKLKFENIEKSAEEMQKTIGAKPR